MVRVCRSILFCSKLIRKLIVGVIILLGFFDNNLLLTNHNVDVDNLIVKLGRISFKNAVNVYKREDLLAMFFNDNLNDCSSGKQVLIFHCEFSQERGPKM